MRSQKGTPKQSMFSLLVYTWLLNVSGFVCSQLNHCEYKLEYWIHLEYDYSDHFLRCTWESKCEKILIIISSSCRGGRLSCPEDTTKLQGSSGQEAAGDESHDWRLPEKNGRREEKTIQAHSEWWALQQQSVVTISISLHVWMYLLWKKFIVHMVNWQISLIPTEIASAQVKVVSDSPKKCVFNRRAGVKPQTSATEETPQSSKVQTPQNQEDRPAFVFTPSKEEFRFNFLWFVP